MEIANSYFNSKWTFKEAGPSRIYGKPCNRRESQSSSLVPALKRPRESNDHENDNHDTQRPKKKLRFHPNTIDNSKWSEFYTYKRGSDKRLMPGYMAYMETVYRYRRATLATQYPDQVDDYFPYPPCPPNNSPERDLGPPEEPLDIAGIMRLYVENGDLVETPESTPEQDDPMVDMIDDAEIEKLLPIVEDMDNGKADQREPLSTSPRNQIDSSGWKNSVSPSRKNKGKGKAKANGGGPETNSHSEFLMPEGLAPGIVGPMCSTNTTVGTVPGQLKGPIVRNLESDERLKGSKTKLEKLLENAPESLRKEMNSVMREIQNFYMVHSYRIGYNQGQKSFLSQALDIAQTSKAL